MLNLLLKKKKSETATEGRNREMFKLLLKERMEKMLKLLLKEFMGKMLKLRMKE